MESASHESSKWWARWRRNRDAQQPQPDALVQIWKAAWLHGANAAWAPRHFDTNPYTIGMERAAWEAGWKWAAANPDRRANRVPRYAHPHRREADSKLPSSLKRAAAVGATGVTLYAISKALRRWMGGTPPDAS